MLSILHVLSSLKLGGAERFTIELARLQCEQGLDARILNLGSESDFLVPVVRGHGIPLVISEVGGSRWQRLRAIRRLLRECDVVHLHSPKSLHFLAPLLMSRSRTLIYTRHGLDPLEGVYMHVLHAVMKPFIRRVTFVTPAGREVFRANYGWDAKLAVIENGVYIPPRHEISTALPLRFGSVGRMVELKGQRLLLEALRGMGAHGGGFELHFYGSGPLEPALRAQAATIAAPRIAFHGEVSDIGSIYENVDVLVVASETEGLSMVIIEAMARGIPVIATNVGGNPTLVKPERTGLLVPYGDLDALRQAIARFVDEPALVRRLGEEARSFITEHYSLLKTHERFLECYTASGIELRAPAPRGGA